MFPDYLSVSYDNGFYISVKDRPVGDNGKKLNGHISNKDYFTCKKVWSEFNVKKDVFLLADVFEKFIDTCLKFYKLVPSHYFSSPGLSWGGQC